MQWTFLLAQRHGSNIDDLTGAVTKFRLEYRLNRPVKITLDVPSDDPKVSAIFTDGFGASFPMVTDMRTIKAYRGSGSTKTLRANCYIMGISDRGDGDEAHTTITAYSPEIRFARRLARNANGIHVRALSFPTQNAAAIVKELIIRSNAADYDPSPDGLFDVTGVLADGSTTLDGSIPSIARVLELRTVGEVLSDLSSNVPFDYRLEWLNQINGYLARIHFDAARGQSRPDFTLGWGVMDNNASAVEYVTDCSTLCNSFHAHGGRGIRKEAHAHDLTSMSDYGVHEDHGIFESVTIQDYLDRIALTAVALRKRPRQMVNFTPMPEKVEPFVQFDLGDTFQVGAGSRLRGGFIGVQRCYGFDIEGDGKGERTTAIYTTTEETT